MLEPIHNVPRINAATALSAASTGGLAPHKLQKVLAYVEEKLAEPVGVRELASQVHMSPFHFARRFKQAVGTPPHAYITHVRIERAKSLLAGTNVPLIEVATRVGYRTQAHFTGVFHRYVGTTPRAYRLGTRKELIPQGTVISTANVEQAVAV
ncbi:MAG TPA: AraC family transcriptional regulator [Usitatibacter sp.]|nr:AraC family transcriptional regulator [Usitatibacter sp.]